jgi:hypothetical protein
MVIAISSLVSITGYPFQADFGDANAHILHLFVLPVDPRRDHHPIRDGAP